MIAPPNTFAAMTTTSNEFNRRIIIINYSRFDNALAPVPAPAPARAIATANKLSEIRAVEATPVIPEEEEEEEMPQLLDN